MSNLTKVVFYEEPNEYTGETDILVVFPDYINDYNGCIGCYSHVGTAFIFDCGKMFERC